jgi:hypothetical protein
MYGERVSERVSTVGEREEGKGKGGLYVRRGKGKGREGV